MNATAAGPLAGLAQRESGLIVPAHLAGIPEEPETGTAAAGYAKDTDGRRRILISKDARKRFSRLAGDLDRDDLAFVLFCRVTRDVVKHVKDLETGADVAVTFKEPIPNACGEVLVREGEGTPDPGFGCKCTRVHFTRF